MRTVVLVSSIRSTLLVIGAVGALCLAGQAQTIVDTQTDFSLLGQGINGLQYGYYDSPGLTGSFTTANMVANPVGRWEGPYGDQTPVFSPTLTHEAVDSSGGVIFSSVRRFTDGNGIGPSYTGNAEIVFQIWKTPFGSVGNGVDAFITYNGVNIFETRIPNGSTQANPFVSSQISIHLAPGDTIDFGITDSTRDGISDVVGFTAQVNAVPEPSLLSLVGFGFPVLAIYGMRLSFGKNVSLKR